MRTSNSVGEKSSDRVFVCGAGHQGLSMAAHLSLNGVKVTLWNRSIKHIEDIAQHRKIYCNGVVNGIAEIEKASDDLGETISDFVMVTTPSNAHRDIAKKLVPYVHKDMVIILNPGRTFGAIEFYFALQQYGAKELPHIAETQTIVYTCRKSSENSTTIFALKNNVKIAALKNSDIGYIMKKMPNCLKKYFSIVDSVAVTSFSNVGMILHCSPVLMNIGWIETEKVNFKYYYDGISRSVASFLEKMDDERIKVAKALGCEIESVAEWMRGTYNVSGTDLYECIRNNKFYKEIDAPSTISCRYILEDVPNGLVPIEFLGKRTGVETQNITTIISLASALLDIDFRKIGRKFSVDTLQKNF